MFSFMRYLPLFFLSVATLLISCQNDEAQPQFAPEILTGNVLIGHTGHVSMSAEVVRHRNKFKSYGFEYSEDPTFESNVADLESDIDSIENNFTLEIVSGLQRGVRYYYRAFVETDSLVYGEVEDFSFGGYTPQIISFSQSSGQIGDTLEIKGKNLYEEGVTTRVRFSIEGSSLVSISDTLIRCIVPATLTDIDNNVKVILGQNFSNGVDFKLNSPVISSFNPQEGFDGTIITLEGENFSKSPQLNQILVQQNLATVLESNGTRLRFEIPQMEYYGPADIELQIGPHSISLNQKIEIIGPKILSLSSNSGFSKEVLTITGEHLNQNGNDIVVWFDEYRADIQSVSETEIICTVPIAYSYNLLEENLMAVSVKNGLKTSPAQYFTLRPRWNQESTISMDGESYSSINGFVYEGDLYLLSTFQNIYKYSMASQRLESFINHPEFVPTHAIMTSYNGKIVSIGGEYSQTSYWELNMETEEWTQLDDLPFEYPGVASTYFILDGAMYLVNYTKEFWKLEDGVFTQLSSFSERSSDWIGSFVVNNRPFVFSEEKMLEYDLSSDSWIQRKTPPFRGLASFEKDGYGYTLSDGFDTPDQMARYDIEKDEWEIISAFPGCHSYSNFNYNKDSSAKRVFVVNNQPYILAHWYYGDCGDPTLFSYDF